MTSGPITLDDIVRVLELGAEDFDAGGERAGFSLLDHGLQCADLLARARPDDVALQVAGLVHDIGQTLTDNDEAAHGEAGAGFVEAALGARVATLVRLHVPAKRYLVAVDPRYAVQLSPASVESLSLQGGAMDAADVAAFDQLENSADAALLRRCDDEAKVVGALVPNLQKWLPLLRFLANSPAGR